MQVEGLRRGKEVVTWGGGGAMRNTFETIVNLCNKNVLRALFKRSFTAEQKLKPVIVVRESL